MKYLELNFTLSPTDEAACDVLAALLAEVGAETFVPTDSGLTAYIQQDVFAEDSVQAAQLSFTDIFPTTVISYTCQPAPDENWNATWEAEHHFQPISLPDGSLVNIVPRQAFGSGEHATTQMMLQLLGTIDLHDFQVIDAGCGTGVLGIAALKLGASRVFAYDIDEWSVKNAIDNFALNDVTATSASDDTESRTSPSAIVCLGDATSALPQAPDADLLLANINRNILLSDLPAFADKVKTDGWLFLSGFLEADIKSLVKCATELGFQLKDTCADNEWRALKFLKS